MIIINLIYTFYLYQHCPFRGSICVSQLSYPFLDPLILLRVNMLEEQTLYFFFQSNYCLIDGLCYQNGTNLTGQTCSFCDRSLDPYSWTLHSDYCLIDDVCYPNGTLKSSDACKVCLTTADSTDWTTDNVTGK